MARRVIAKSKARLYTARAASLLGTLVGRERGNDPRYPVAQACLTDPRIRPEAFLVEELGIGGPAGA